MAFITYPFTLTAGQPENVNQLNSNLEAIRTVLNGGVDGVNLSAAVQAAAGLNGASTRRGKSIVATEESRTNTEHGLLTTPDRVAGIVLPTDGLIIVGYQAAWKESVNSAARAAIFLKNSVGTDNQLKVYANPENTEEAWTGGGAGDIYRFLSTWHAGLFGHTGTPAGGVTTGLALGAAFPGGGNVAYGLAGGTSSVAAPGAGGFCAIVANPGTYDVSVQYKAASGSVTAKDRKLWVWTMGF